MSAVGALEPPPERWPVIRDALVLQLKLILEGMKDLALGPIALGAAIIDLVNDRRPGRSSAFYRVVRMGARYERWLNLYGALERHEQGDIAPHPDDPGIDAYFGKIEEALRRQHDKGGVASGAKSTVDVWLNRIQDLSRKNPPEK